MFKYQQTGMKFTYVDVCAFKATWLYTLNYTLNIFRLLIPSLIFFLFALVSNFVNFRYEYSKEFAHELRILTMTIPELVFAFIFSEPPVFKFCGLGMINRKVWEKLRRIEAQSICSLYGMVVIVVYQTILKTTLTACFNFKGQRPIIFFFIVHKNG